MKVNLDQIEFYHGASLQRLSTSAKKVPSGHAAAHAPRNSQHYSPPGFGFCPRPNKAPLGQAPPLTVSNYEWNIFDVEIDNLYGPTRPQVLKDVNPAVRTNMPSTNDVLLHDGSSALAEPVLLRDSTTPVPCPARADHLERIPPDIRENDSPVPDTKEIEASRLSCVPCATAPVPASEQASTTFSNLFAVDDSQEESAKPKLSIMGPSYSNNMHPGHCKKETEPSQTSELDGDPCPRVNDTPERTRDSGTAEDKSGPSGSSPPPTVRSAAEFSGARTTLSSGSPVRYPSIAVVVPPPSWKQGAARRSTRAAAAVCNKRLRSGRGTGSHQDGNATYGTEQPSQKRKKRKSSIRPSSSPSDHSIPVSCHCSGSIQGIRGSALLTVESNSGLKPAYYFTFVPDPSPILSQPRTTDTAGKQKPYSSDENALLVQLKEREAMPWSEITAHFPGRNVSSLQVHYSTKLRNKASSRSGKPRRRV